MSSQQRHANVPEPGDGGPASLRWLLRHLPRPAGAEPAAPASEPDHDPSPQERPVPMPSHLAPPASRQMTKRSLITVSHAIEQAAVAAVATADEPVVLISLFQRPLYFDRERQAYRELARTTTLTVVGIVDTDPDVAPGIEGIAIDPDDPLAAEWSVTMLTPHTGAVLYATDREQVLPGETTLEAARLFDGWYSFHRSHAVDQVVRLRQAFGDRLPAAARAVLGEVLDEANSRSTNPAEERTDAALRLVVEKLEAANQRLRVVNSELAAAGLRGGQDMLTGLRDRVWLQRYLGPGTGAAGDTLSLALIRLDINGLDRLNRWSGKAVGDDLLRHVAMLIQRPLREIDHAVRLQDDDFLLVLPNLSEEQASRLATRLVGEISALQTYQTPQGGLSATAAVTVTRDRPLPFDALEEVLRQAKRDRTAVTFVGGVRSQWDSRNSAHIDGRAAASAITARPYVA